MTSLVCDNGTVRIVNATYGRNNGEPLLEQCKGADINHMIPDSNKACGKTDVRPHLQKICNGKKKCSVEARKGVFGEPCLGFRKFMIGYYFCGITGK